MPGDLPDAVVFDNGPAIGGGFEATESLVADDFRFDDTTTVGGAGVFMDGQIDHWTGGFQYSIYSVVNGQKGALLGTGSVINVTKLTNSKWYVSTLTGVQLTAGTSYMLALTPSGSFNGSYIGSEMDGVLSVFVDYTP